MKTLIRGLIIAIITMLCVFCQTIISEQTVREDELTILTNEAISATQTSMRQQIEDKYYGTHNALCNADDSCFKSNDDYLNDLKQNIEKSISTNSTYYIDVYGVDYEKGYLDVDIKCEYKILNKTKVLSNRKTAIVEVLGTINEAEDYSLLDLPSAKDVIEIDGVRYSVISISGTQAKIVALDTAGSVAFSDSVLVYDESVLDSQAQAYYEMLPGEVQSAIKNSNIMLDSYDDLSNKKNNTIITRKTFALSVTEILDNYENANEIKTLLNINPGESILLRSTSLDGNNSWKIDENGNLVLSPITDVANTRFAFVIDLSEVEFTKE